MFNTAKFLADNFGDADGVLAIVERHNRKNAPKREAARKWFERGSVSAEWWPILIVCLEKETRAAVNLSKYVMRRNGNDLFS